MKPNRFERGGAIVMNRTVWTWLALVVWSGLSLAAEPRRLAGSFDAMGLNGLGLAEGPNAIGFRAVALLPDHGYVDARLLFGNLLRLGPYDPDGSYNRTEWAVPQAPSAVRRCLRAELYRENAIPVPVYSADEAARLRLEWTSDAAGAMARLSTTRPVEAMLYLNGNFDPAEIVRATSSGAALKQGNLAVAVAWSGEVTSGFEPAGNLDEAETAVRGYRAAPGGRRNAGAVRVRVTPERPLYVTLAYGSAARSVETAAIDARLASAEKALAERTMTSTGSAADCADALERLVGFSANYDPRTGGRILPVNRDWAGENGHPPTFMWDNFFDSYLASFAHPELAKESLEQILGIIAERGLEGAPPQRNLIVPIVYAKAVRTIGDVDFTRRTFPAMMKFIRFWFADRGDGHPWRDGNDDGLIECGTCRRPGDGSLGHLVTDAYDETGYDDNPQYSGGFGYNRWAIAADGIRFDYARGTLNLTMVGQNSLYVAACRALAVVAGEIGSAADAKWLRAESDRVAKLIVTRLYNPESGIFQNRFFDGRFQSVLTHDTFSPLAAGVADGATAARLKAILTDPKKFWGENPVPTVSYDDPSFGDFPRGCEDGYWKGTYWRGNVWPSSDYIVYTALRATDWQDVRREYVRRCRRMFMDDWLEHHHANENYPPFGATHATHMFAGNGGRDPHYVWAGLLPLQALEELFSVEDQLSGIRFGAADSPGFGSWTGFRWHGHPGSVSASAGGLSLKLGEELSVTTTKPAEFRNFTWTDAGFDGLVRAPQGATVTVTVRGVARTLAVAPSATFTALK